MSEVFLAEDVREETRQNSMNVKDEEHVDVMMRISLGETVKMIQGGEIADSGTINALFL